MASIELGAPIEVGSAPAEANGGGAGATAAASGAARAGTTAAGGQRNELELAAFLFNLIEAQITRADTKAGLVVAADTVFATALLLSSRGTLALVGDGSAPPLERAAGALLGVLFVTVLASTLCALVAARPTLKVRDDEGTLFFFSRISRMGHDEYVNTFAAQDPALLRKALLTEVHNTAQIAMRKFRLIRYSLDFLIAAIALWAVVQVVLGLLSSGR